MHSGPAQPSGRRAPNRRPLPAQPLRNPPLLTYTLQPRHGTPTACPRTEALQVQAAHVEGVGGLGAAVRQSSVRVPPPPPRALPLSRAAGPFWWLCMRPRTAVLRHVAGYSCVEQVRVIPAGRGKPQLRQATTFGQGSATMCRLPPSPRQLRHHPAGAVSVRRCSKSRAVERGGRADGRAPAGRSGVEGGRHEHETRQLQCCRVEPMHEDGE